MNDQRHDIIIVGCGVAAGAFLAGLPSDAGLSTLIIDRGVYHGVEGRPGGMRGTETDGFFLSVDDQAPTFTPRRWGRDMAGGGSLYWYGQLSRFRQSDLRARSHALARGRADLAATLGDWPIDLADLDPHHLRIERLLAPIGGPDTLATNEVWTARHRTRLSDFERHVIGRLEQAGLQSQVGVTCLGGQAWDLDPVDPFTGQPLAGPGLWRRPSLYHDTRDRVARVPGYTVLDQTTCTRILFDGQRARGVEVIGVDGRRREIEAREVVLAANPIESIGLFQASGHPDPNDMIGAGFTYTTEAVAYVLTDIPRSRDPLDLATGRFASLVMPVLYDGDDGKLVKGGKIAIYDAMAFEAPGRELRETALVGDAWLALKALARDRYILKLSFKGESTPWWGKSVKVLDHPAAVSGYAPWVRYALHEHDHAVRNAALAMFKTICAAMPGGELVSPPLPTGGKLVNCHQHGGLIFGGSPERSVLDRDCASWLFPNLCVVDASIMPSSGATNSSLTMAANAHRVAAIVAERLVGLGRGGHATAHRPGIVPRAALGSC